jgi:hypothetical protein
VAGATNEYDIGAKPPALALALANNRLVADIQVRPAIRRIINLGVSDEPLRSYN